MTGLNQDGAAAAIQNIIGTSADVRLMGTAVDYDDGATELSTKEIDGDDYAAQTVAEADWTITPNVGGEDSELTNDNEIDFGTAGSNWGNVVDVVIHGDGDEFIIADEPSNPDVTMGAEVTIAAGAITYTLG